jgi:hypothetical protein
MVIKLARDLRQVSGISEHSIFSSYKTDQHETTKVLLNNTSITHFADLRILS